MAYGINFDFFQSNNCIQSLFTLFVDAAFLAMQQERELTSCCNQPSGLLNGLYAGILDTELACDDVKSTGIKRDGACVRNYAAHVWKSALDILDSCIGHVKAREFGALPAEHCQRAFDHGAVSAGYVDYSWCTVFLLHDSKEFIPKRQDGGMGDAATPVRACIGGAAPVCIPACGYVVRLES